jgi:hypothetical protein
MHYTISFLLGIFCSTGLFGQGLMPSANHSNNETQMGFAGFGKTMLDPFHSDDLNSDFNTSISLRSFAPSNGSQGVASTSVGWAVAYMAASMAWNIEHEITENSEKALYVFDPLYPQLIAKNAEPSNDYCNSPITFEEVFNAARTSGLKRALDLPFLNCSDLQTPDIKDAYPAKLNKWHTIDLQVSPLEAFYMALKNGLPVVTGIKLTAELLDQTAIQEGVWIHENDHLFLDYQAMVLTGIVKERGRVYLELQTNYGVHFSSEGRILLPASIAHEVIFVAYALEFSFEEAYSSNGCTFEGVKLEFTGKSSMTESMKIVVEDRNFESHYKLNDQDGLVLMTTSKDSEGSSDEFEMLVSRLRLINVLNGQ